MNTFYLGGIFSFICRDRFGNLKWKDKTHNLVTTAGLQKILDMIYSLGGVVADAQYYIGLTGGTPTLNVLDTLSSHAGWTEITGYTEGVRQIYNPARTSLVVSNTASLATFSINASETVGGSFLASSNTGTSGLLLTEAAFSNGNKSVTSGDTIQVEYDFTAASS